LSDDLMMNSKICISLINTCLHKIVSNMKEASVITDISSNPGDVAQMVERSLSMREVRGSMPRFSIFFFFLGKNTSIV
jgi:hypothetical protein